MTIGVYQIRNKSTSVVYIGSSFNVEKRFQKHKNQLNNGTHHNRHLQHSFSKNGIDNFDFLILEICSENISDCELRLKENQYIQLIGMENCYNHCPVAGSTKGKTHSEETKRKLSELGKGRKWTEQAKCKVRQALTGYRHSDEMKSKCSAIRKGKPIKKRWKSVQQIDVNTSIVLKIYPSNAIAAQETGIDAASISRVCNDKAKQAGGYLWKFYESSN